MRNENAEMEGVMNFDDLNDMREKIDVIDGKILKLFEERMATALNIADYKRENNLPIISTERERDILSRITKGQSDELASYTKVLFTTLFDLSKTYQERDMGESSELVASIKKALASTPKLFPKSATVACQGVEGANSQIACDRLFTRPNIMYVNSFEAVFTAVENGLCEYGILPIENNLHGSVTEVYDLMKKYKSYIARSVKLKINHALLARKGAKLSDITEIFSHEQALHQCSNFLQELKNVKITPCENTAVAAKNVFDSDRCDIAAIADINCANLYNLDIIRDDIQNSDNNYTRFICISKFIQIFPGANKISLMFNLPHRPGSLYGIISKFSAIGVNLTKLESRPIAGGDFEFMFYSDLEADVNDEMVMNLLAQLECSVPKLGFLGSYGEV